MKQLSCRSLGEDCDFVATGETEDEVIEKGMEHTKNDHPDVWARMQQMSQEEKDKEMKEMKSKKY